MSKNLNIENTLKEDKNEEFLAFVKDYNALQVTQSNYEFAIGSFTGAIVLLLVSESLAYYQIEDIILKNIMIFSLLFLFVIFLGKTMLEVFNGFLSIKQRKKDLKIMQEKAHGWIELYKDKENKLSLARDFIVRLENLEKIKLENITTDNIKKSIQSQKTEIYNLVKYEININSFNRIESLLIIMHNLETNIMSLYKGEQELKQIKNEIHSGISNNSSNSFKDNKNSQSFS